MPDGYTRTSPVDAFQPNGYGPEDMIGNVRKWTVDWYAARPTDATPKSCRIPVDRRGGKEQNSYDSSDGLVRIPRKMLIGGPYLCAPNYCRCYRAAARQAKPVYVGMAHGGFRCVVRAPAR